MLRGSFQRAAMAILLVGMMIAPLGICLQQNSKAAHSCCMRQQSLHCLQTNCCSFRTQLPAIVLAPPLPNPTPGEASHEYVASLNAITPDEHPPVAAIPPLSPPTGAYTLRI